jgi:GGDEF domain-containing protein
MDELSANDFNTSDLLNMLKELAWNDEYGCYTRQGFQKMVWPKIAAKARWIIFFDIDGMGVLNEQHTHAGVNAIIKKSLEVRTSDFMTGQRYSGDEFMVVITDDPERGETKPVELAMRLKEALQENGASATFAIAPVISDDLMENVEPAVQLVEAAKRNNERGVIILAPGDPR